MRRTALRITSVLVAAMLGVLAGSMKREPTPEEATAIAVAQAAAQRATCDRLYKGDSTGRAHDPVCAGF